MEGYVFRWRSCGYAERMAFRQSQQKEHLRHFFGMLRASQDGRGSADGKREAQLSRSGNANQLDFAARLIFSARSLRVLLRPPYEADHLAIHNFEAFLTAQLDCLTTPASRPTTRERALPLMRFEHSTKRTDSNINTT